MAEVKVIASLYGQHTRWCVFDKLGISPCLTSAMGCGGGFIPMVMEIEDEDVYRSESGGQRTEYCRCIKARYTAGYTNHKGDNSGVIESIKVKDGTSKGYAECPIGGVMDVAFPDSKTRRGRVQEDGKVCGTLDTGSQHGLVEGKYRIRRLTPKECFRLQGWDDKSFEKAQMVNSDSQLYKQAGNGVSVNVITAIAENLRLEEQY